MSVWRGACPMPRGVRGVRPMLWGVRPMPWADCPMPWGVRPVPSGDAALGGACRLRPRPVPRAARQLYRRRHRRAARVARRVRAAVPGDGRLRRLRLRAGAQQHVLAEARHVRAPHGRPRRHRLHEACGGAQLSDPGRTQLPRDDAPPVMTDPTTTARRTAV